jgi:hypothetical protein
MSIFEKGEKFFRKIRFGRHSFSQPASLRSGPSKRILLPLGRRRRGRTQGRRWNRPNLASCQCPVSFVYTPVIALISFIYSDATLILRIAGFLRSHLRPTALEGTASVLIREPLATERTAPARLRRRVPEGRDWPSFKRVRYALFPLGHYRQCGHRRHSLA